MADYEVNDYTGQANSLAEVLALLEAKIEEFDDAKTIHYVDVFHVGQYWHYALVIKAQISWTLGIVSIVDASLNLVTLIDVWLVSQKQVAEQKGEYNGTKHKIKNEEKKQIKN